MATVSAAITATSVRMCVSPERAAVKKPVCV
jgi:hypothetical protein